MNLTTLMILETLVDLAAIVVSLLVLRRFVPAPWKAKIVLALKARRRPRTQALRPAPAAQPANGPARAPRQEDRPLALDVYGQIPALAANGLSAAQIVQRLGLSRGEVELGLKMSRSRREGVNDY